MSIAISIDVNIAISIDSSIDPHLTLALYFVVGYSNSLITLKWYPWLLPLPVLQRDKGVEFILTVQVALTAE